MSDQKFPWVEEMGVKSATKFELLVGPVWSTVQKASPNPSASSQSRNYSLPGGMARKSENNK